MIQLNLVYFCLINIFIGASNGRMDVIIFALKGAKKDNWVYSKASGEAQPYRSVPTPTLSVQCTC